ncbi:MAG: class I SAM-dependent methyltransferase [Phenylobacterium sp.]|uniref:class I SAM-dependent methyltransferase n=1 Tax=Phenylobacterium sp. TaxID=1871053 RepID=UPI001A62F3F1|nr:methyltransferase domain-containing protein [Phenylobacterium sp.]MBL8772870.1 class I SAM-dependent methyltransferase [Phenylobacterium sp.]
MHRLAPLGAVVLALSVTAPAVAADAKLQAAVAGAQRSDAHKARDAARRPVETLTFWGIKPKQTVIELSPGSGYWTEILSPYAKATGGTYYATAADLNNPNLSEAAKAGRTAFEKRYADTAKYGEVKLVNFGPMSGPLGAPGSADVVITARNLHNWAPNAAFLDKVLKDVHAVLKPGGVFAVEEHRADPKPSAPNWSTGYMTEAEVIAALEKAGFKLQAKSEVNANPKDTKDHPFGVWTLPPSRWTTAGGRGSDPNFDRTKYDAIGESDRMTLRFVKAR